MNVQAIEKQIIVDDGHILLQKPLEIIKYGKKVQLRPVNWFYEWKDFSYALGVFLHYYYVVCGNSRLPDTLNDLAQFKENIQATITHRQAHKMMCKICRWSGFKLRWMKKKFTLDDWIEIFIWVFFYNVVLIKKSLKDALKATGKAQSL